MFTSTQAQRTRSKRSVDQPGRLPGVLPLAALAALLIATLAASAFASSASLTLGSASSSTLGKRVVVNAQGRTLYALTPETRGHLLCRSKECLKRWPPLTVGSGKTRLKPGTGVHGALGILKRADGMRQLTLRGLPLYRFAGDRAKGDANGEGIESFGGTWHAMNASSGAVNIMPGAPVTPNTPATPNPPTTPSMPSTPTTPSMPTTPSAPPPYGYPSY
jgi:predicted lipoprotein with Yx(FWY)xxD motif